MSLWEYRKSWLTPVIHLCLPSLPDSLQNYILCQYRPAIRWILIDRQKIARPCVGVYMRTLIIMSCSFSLDVLEMGDKCPYRCVFVECSFQKVFNRARTLLVQFPFSFFSIRFVNVHVVDPVNCTIRIHQT